MLNDSLGNAAYHVRILDDSGVIELVRTRKVRGSTQHFYASTVAHFAEVVSILADTEKQDRRSRK